MDTAKTGWIQTYTGKQFFLLEPKPEDIDILDIAHALSMNCRFNGHCTDFYSVAEHSVRVCDCVKNLAQVRVGEFYPLIDDIDATIVLQAWGLLHDSAEAMISDVTKPVKKMFPRFSEIEDDLMKVIMKALGVPCLCEKEHIQIIKDADDILLATEKRDLMVPSEHKWLLVNAKPANFHIVPFSHKKAKRKFLKYWEKIDYALQIFKTKAAIPN